MCSGIRCLRLAPALFVLIAFASKAASAQHSTATTSTSGAVVYALNCIKCHSADGGGISAVVSMLGPSLKAEHDRQFVSNMVANGKAPMPSFRPLLSSAQIDAVADYVTTQIATIPLASGDVSEGGELFRVNCAPCHGAPARGGALAYAGINAPSLTDKDAARIAGAIRWGPGPMPSFPQSVVNDQQLDSIVTYIQVLRRPPHAGGVPLGYFGPVAEGIVSWVAALLLVGAAMWIERKGKG
ncbi:MAG: c-type cytochrome [Candidatus Acidiferrales bacterium]